MVQRISAQSILIALAQFGHVNNPLRQKLSYRLRSAIKRCPAIKDGLPRLVKCAYKYEHLVGVEREIMIFEMGLHFCHPAFRIAL
jgi:hypothetical protein